MNPIFLRPGQQLKRYGIYRKSTMTDGKGKLSYAVDEMMIGSLLGSLSSVKEREAERWKQQGHNVTHKIVARGSVIAQAEDVLKFGNKKYYVLATDDKANLGLFTTIYCEYRAGV